MLELVDGLIFYHGSYCEVRQPEARYGAKYKDFGQGFYLTSSKKQARNFIQTSVKKAGLSGRIETQQIIFEEMKKYDIIGGKIANDNTNATIAA